MRSLHYSSPPKPCIEDDVRGVLQCILPQCCRWLVCCRQVEPGISFQPRHWWNQKLGSIRIASAVCAQLGKLTMQRVTLLLHDRVANVVNHDFLAREFFRYPLISFGALCKLVHISCSHLRAYMLHSARVRGAASIACFVNHLLRKLPRPAERRIIRKHIRSCIRGPRPLH